MDNYLVDHDSLIPLAYLAALQLLNLQGNPLSYHPQHRIRSVRCLHKNTATVKFILDDVGLSKSEKQSINSLHPKILSAEPSSSSHNSEGNDIFDRSIRIRPAVIADDILDCLESSLPSVVSHASPVESDNKEQLASLHKDYIRILYDKAGVSARDAIKEGNGFAETHQQLLSSTPLGESILNTIQDTLKEDNDLSNNTTGEYITASDNANNEEQPDVYTDMPTDENQEAETTEESEDEELESGESNIFMANLKGGNDIIVILTQTHITEKDPINMKSLGRFTLDSLYTCNKIIEDDIEYIYLEFDTVRINSSKYYSIEDEEDRNRFYDKLRNIIDSRPPKEISNLFKCMKCSTQFGVEDQKTMHRVVIKCPLCESDLVFQEDGN